MSLIDVEEFVEAEGENATATDVTQSFRVVSECVRKLNEKLGADDVAARMKAFETIAAELKRLQKMEEVPNFVESLFDTNFVKSFLFLVQAENTEVSAMFVSILNDICEKESVIERLRKSDCVFEAINSCVRVDEANIQNDAQFLYDTLSLIATILDGCEDGREYAETLVEKTKLLEILQRQFSRDDFDENVLAASELLSVILQFQPKLVQKVDIGLLNMLLRFCANERNPKTMGEDEAAHNAFNTVILFALDPKGNEMLAELKGVELLLSCWSPSAATAGLAIKAIEAGVSASSSLCEQFVEAGGLKKLFGSLKPTSKVDKTFSIIAIIDALLTMLPVESTAFKRVLRKFCERDCEKIKHFFAVSEFVALQQSEEEEEEEDSAFSTLMLCCSVISVLFAYCTTEGRVEIVTQISESETLDLETIIETAELRIENTSGLERVKDSIDVLRQVEAL